MADIRKREDKLQRLSIRDGVNVAIDKRRQEEWKEGYEQRLSRRYNNSSEKSLTKIAREYNSTETIYRLYVEKYLNAKNEKEGADKTAIIQRQSTEQSKQVEKLISSLREHTNAIEDPVIKQLIINDISYLKESLPDHIKSIGELLKELSLWNEYIEREEALNIALLAFTDIIDLELSVFASVNHEAKNTEVSLIRRTLSKKYDKSIFLKKIIDEGLTNNTTVDYDSVAEKIIKSLENYYKDPENRKIALVSIMSSQDAKKRRNILLGTSWLLAIQKFARPALFTIGVVALFTPIPFIQLPALALIGISVGVELFPVLTQFLIGKKLLPNVDSNAEHFVDKSKEEVDYVKKNLKIELGENEIHEENKLGTKSLPDTKKETEHKNTLDQPNEATVEKPNTSYGFFNAINEYVKLKLASITAYGIKKDGSTTICVGKDLDHR